MSHAPVLCPLCTALYVIDPQMEFELPLFYSSYPPYPMAATYPRVNNGRNTSVPELPPGPTQKLFFPLLWSTVPLMTRV